MKTQILALSLISTIAIVTSAGAQVQTQLGDVKDSRTTGQFFGGLTVNIKLLGDSVADAESIRTVINTAVDDTGRDLIDHEKQKYGWRTEQHHHATEGSESNGGGRGIPR